jgi:DNA-binding transcriptional MerR regulator
MAEGEPETYAIDEAGRTLGVSAEDIRAYIEEGLVTPRQGEGGVPCFARVDMRRLWSIVTLHRDLGINLPGVAAVLGLREQFERARRDLATLVEIVERELGPDCWDRLWPEGRPRPGGDLPAEGFSDAATAEATPESADPKAGGGKRAAGGKGGKSPAQGDASEGAAS